MTNFSECIPIVKRCMTVYLIGRNNKEGIKTLKADECHTIQGICIRN